MGLRADSAKVAVNILFLRPMILSCILSLAAWLHPVHLSVTEVDYSAKDKTLQITSRIFIDDLELSIRRATGDSDLDLLRPSGTTTDKLVSEYVLRHLSLKTDGKPLALRYLGHEIEDVAIICYIESATVRKVSVVEVTNSVIHQTHSDQSNIVHLTFNGPVQSARLTLDEPTHRFQIVKK